MSLTTTYLVNENDELTSHAYCRSAGDQFRGDYHYNEVSDMITGNPARAANVQDMLDSIQKKDKASGDARNHAQAITIDGMKTFMEWSLKEVPMSAIDQSFDNDITSLVRCAWHFMIRAVATTGFVIWARYYQSHAAIMRQHDLS